MAIEQSVKLLWQSAQTLNGNSHTERLLKSYYINTSRKIAKNKAQLPNEQYGISKMCPRCACDWNESEFQLRLKPQLLAKNAKARKLITKLEESKNKHNLGLLTQSQRKRAKWLKKRTVSNLQICCDFCKHKTLVPLEKPRKRAKPIESDREVSLETNNFALPQKKKKKKPKDTNAGLKIVKLANPQPQTTVKPNVPKADLPKQKHIDTKNAPSQTKAAKPTHTKGKIAAKPPTSVISKNKKKAKKPQSIAPKMQSKTQQQNALLQLASLLKTQASKTAANTPQSRLESLLK